MSDPLSEKEIFLCNCICSVLSQHEATSLEGMQALLSCFIGGYHLAYSSLERVQFEKAIKVYFESAVKNVMKAYDEAKKNDLD